MTAVSLFVQDHAAHLVTDAAYYDADGQMVATRSKVAINAAARMAIGCSGCVQDHQIATALGLCDGQADVLSRLPDVVRAIRADNTAQSANLPTIELMLFVALWSTERDRAEGYVIASDRAYLGDGYTPGTLVDVLQLTSPPMPTIDLASFDADRDAAGLLEAQRRYAWPNDPNCYVGGYGELTTVTWGGVERRRVVEWADVIGEPIAV
jgi:hypothetical protein